MSKVPEKFELEFLDHVALRVKNLEVSAKWYQNVLGLKKVELPEWGPFPVFLLSGQTGVALFPANEKDPKLDQASKNVKIDHFAFRVSNENFDKAIEHYKTLNLEYQVQDHHYFYSVYTRDPDGHQVELTTQIKDHPEL